MKTIDNEMKGFFPEVISASWAEKQFGKNVFDLNALQKTINEPIWEMLSRGGKRWRPKFATLACEAVGGNKKDVLPFLVLPEFIHNGSLIIDDIQDKSTLRRGKKCCHLIYGTDIAINVGNIMYFLPLLSLVNKNKLSPEVRLQIFELYSKTMIGLSLGQAIDMYWHQGKSKPTEEQYLQMCKSKTGALANFSARMGAIIGGGTKEQIEALGEFAISLGVAFQIRDDILNIKSTENLGKGYGDDIIEGKFSLLVIHAFEELPKDKAKILREILIKEKKTEKEIGVAIKLIVDSGAIEYAEDMIASILADSWAKVDSCLPNSKAKKGLKEFVDYLI